MASGERTIAIILIVEDDEDVLDYIKAYVLDWGHTVLEATTGAGAILAMRKLLPDLVIMDIGLPDMTGFEAVQLIRKDAETANLTVIALTALDTDEGRQKGEEAGFAAYLTKPIIDVEELREAVESNLGD
ncbi:MAG: two-component system response regulator [Rhodospirillaceae bacterium]|nr:two-component system response regulator [Rhodospirillaceae bacterium]